MSDTELDFLLELDRELHTSGSAPQLDAPAQPSGAPRVHVSAKTPQQHSAEALPPPATCRAQAAAHRAPPADQSHSPAPHKRPRVRNQQTALRLSTPESAAAPRRHTGTCPLASLPADLLRSLFRKAGAADLTQLARVCRVFRRAADDEALWRRLYCSRWGTFAGGEAKVLDPGFWKRTYRERDRADYARNVAPVQEGDLRAQYHASHMTERAATVSAAKEPSWSLQTCSAQEQLAAYLRARHFAPAAAKPADTSAMRLIRFGDVFVDEGSGWTHVCDSSCDAQAPDEAGVQLVCPLTGRVHGQVPAEWCERAVGAGPEPEPDGACVGGWMAQVYEAGYRHNDDDRPDLDSGSLVTLQLS